MQRLRWEHWAAPHQYRRKPTQKQWKKKLNKPCNSARKILSVLQLTLFTVQLILCFYSFVWTFNQFPWVFICVPSCSGFIRAWTDFIKSLQAGYFYCTLHHFYFCLNKLALVSGWSKAHHSSAPVTVRWFDSISTISSVCNTRTARVGQTKTQSPLPCLMIKVIQSGCPVMGMARRQAHFITFPVYLWSRGSLSLCSWTLFL